MILEPGIGGSPGIVGDEGSLHTLTPVPGTGTDDVAKNRLLPDRWILDRVFGIQGDSLSRHRSRAIHTVVHIGILLFSHILLS